MKSSSEKNDLVQLAISAFAIAAFSAYSLAQSPTDTAPANQPAAKEHMPAGAQRMFTEHDTNKDGDLTLAEVRAGHEKYKVGANTN